jgi:hypothetical protein
VGKLLTALLFGACVSQATVIITIGNNQSGTENNVLLNPIASTNVVVGSFTQQTTAVPQFQSTEPLSVSTSDQSRIVAVDGFLNTVTFSLQAGFTFGDLIFALNPQNGNSTDFTITANGTSASQTANGALAIADQFFTITSSGEALSSLVLQSKVGFENIRQFSVSAITAPGGSGGRQLPEPGTIVMFAVGLGLLMLGRKWN